MALSAVSTIAAAPSQSLLQSLTQHKHGRHHASLTDVDAQSSSIALGGSSATGKVGSKVDLSA